MIAKGSGYIAEQILVLAKDNDIHVHEDPDLLNVLSVLGIQSEIPEHLYLAAAEVLAFVYQLNNTLSGD
ncbi:MAG: EscU/YscU/HrcU family type III secretion system export apparatus switch protein [Candidatus Hydrogenedentota bacterium]|jgi:flagellar biosynthesis protein